jgi:site-specific recombinase XerD
MVGKIEMDESTRSKTQVLASPQFNLPGIKKEKLKYFIMEFLMSLRSKKTARDYLGDLEDFFLNVEHQGLKIIDEFFCIKSTHILVFKNSLEKRKYSPRTISRKLASISSLFQFLIEKKMLRENPARLVKRPRIQKEVTTTDFSNIEVLRILEVIDDTQLSGLLHKTILMGLFFLGLRSNELITLKIKDLLKNNNQWGIKFVAKGGAERIIPLPEEVRLILGQYLKMRKIEANRFGQDDVSPESFLFISVKNTRNGVNHRISKSGLDYILDRYVKKAGISHKFSVHSTRATFIGAALEKGVPIDKVASWVDHKDINLTRAYSKRRNLIEVSKQLEDLYGK